jgi:aminopeptidase-like protein
MRLEVFLQGWDPASHGQAMYQRVTDLYPICRSITGNGFRETLRRLHPDVPLQLHEVPTGTRVFDWTVPKEWNVQEAWIKDSRGEKVVDFARHNLHLLNYSVPFCGTLTLEELRPHLYTLPDRPDWIPYRTSYYKEDWGFCLSQRQLDAMTEGSYEVLVDTSLADGHLTYGECLLPGEETDEVLVSCHACHPSLANDNLSGVALTSALVSILSRLERRWSYRFLFVPGTIGPIVWLARNDERTEKIRAGLVVACVGDPGSFNFKRTRRGNTELDRAAEHVLRHLGGDAVVEAFSPYGYDERQYGSPGFDLPVGSLRRTPHGRYPQYHTSADDLSLVRADCLAESLRCYLEIVRVLEDNRAYVNLNPKCEPQLGRRGLYSLLGGRTDAKRGEMAMLWVLNLSDGRNSLLDIAERSGMPFREIAAATRELLGVGLLEERKAA